MEDIRIVVFRHHDPKWTYDKDWGRVPLGAKKLLAQITHLRVANNLARVAKPEKPTLHFSSLTHLSYHGHVHDAQPVLVGNMPALEQIVVTTHGDPLAESWNLRLYFRPFNFGQEESVVWLHDAEGRESRLWY
jgi:hypothetical protein